MSLTGPGRRQTAMNCSLLTPILLLGTLNPSVAVGAKGQGLGDKSAAPTPAPSADERTKAFTWFGTLGFSDVKDRKLVRVATGRWHSSGGDPPQNTFVAGFLLKEEGSDFTIQTLSLTTE